MENKPFVQLAKDMMKNNEGLELVFETAAMLLMSIMVQARGVQSREQFVVILFHYMQQLLHEADNIHLDRTHMEMLTEISAYVPEVLTQYKRAVREN